VFSLPDPNEFIRDDRPDESEFADDADELLPVEFDTVVDAVPVVASAM
jgi:hypothetical protein